MALLLAVVLAISQGSAKSNTVTNPLGFAYDLPAGWSVSATQGTFQVLKRPGQTANEVYIVGGVVEFDAKTSWDDKLQTDDVTMMKSLGPWTPSSDVKTFDAKGGKGMLRAFAGSNQGVQFHAEVWSLLADKKRFGILAIGPDDMKTSLFTDAYSIATSLRPDTARKIETNNAHAKEWSEKLAGYKFVASNASDSGSLNGSGGDAGERTLVFLSDGTFQFSSHHMTFVSAGDFSASSEHTDEVSGRWSVQSDGANAFLILEPTGKPKESLTLKQVGQYILFNGAAYSRVG